MKPRLEHESILNCRQDKKWGHTTKMRRCRWDSEQLERLQHNRWEPCNTSIEKTWDRRKMTWICVQLARRIEFQILVVSDFREVGSRIVTRSFRTNGTAHVGVIKFYKIGKKKNKDFKSRIWFDMIDGLIQKDQILTLIYSNLNT